jgi:hypothetical protein
MLKKLKKILIMLEICIIQSALECPEVQPNLLCLISCAQQEEQRNTLDCLLNKILNVNIDLLILSIQTR